MRRPIGFLEEAHQAIRIRVRQGRNDHAFDGTENRRVCTDGEGESHHRGQRESWRAAKKAKSVSRVVQHVGHEAISSSAGPFRQRPVCFRKIPDASNGVVHNHSPRDAFAIVRADTLPLLEHVTDDPLAIRRRSRQGDDGEGDAFERGHHEASYRVLSRRSRPAVMAPNAL
jgi:hypothetical protein